VSDPKEVQIPSKAVSGDTDIREPARNLLEDLNLLGTREETQQAKGFTAAFTGPPQSVALIEAGATAAAKWWAAGLGALLIPVWASVAGWWPDQETNVKVVVLGGAAVVTAALIGAIGYLIASDVRGRAAAAVSMIEARATIATNIVDAARAVYEPTSAESATEIVPLPGSVKAKYLPAKGDEETGWRVVAMERQSDGSIKYIVVKGSQEKKASASELVFS
jgi:hypothetical protein